MSIKIEVILKFILAGFLFLCLLDMPYGYFQFVRFIAFVGFAFLAYKSNERSNKTEMIVYIIFALLFQPFIKISLGRELWNIVDVVVGVVLILSVFMDFNRIKESKANEE